MKAYVSGSAEFTAQLEIRLEPDTDIERALLESFDKHVTTWRFEDGLNATLSIGRDTD